MIAAFIAGLAVAALGVLASFAAQNWEIAFIISATVSGITLVMSSTFHSASSMMQKGIKAKDEQMFKAVKEGASWTNALTAFSIPNIVTAVILYFKLYR